MSREKINEEFKKARFSITINNKLSKLMKKEKSNVSKYIEWLVYQDLLKDNSRIKDILI